MLTLKLLLYLETLCRRYAFRLQMKRVQIASRIIHELELSIKAIDERAEEAKKKVREQIEEVNKIQ